MNPPASLSKTAASFSYQPKDIILHILACGVIIGAIILPLRTYTVALSEKLLAEEKQLNAQQQLVMNQQKMREELSIIQNELSFSSIVLSEKEIVSFVEKMESLAIATEVKQQIQLHNENRTVQGDIVRIPASIVITGSLDHLIKYISAIEQQDVYINPQNISIDHKPLEKEQSLEMVVYTYWKTE
ncbi:MAG TPA: type 4a pilus biogenesis protein PilO [Patescibacteria group bacterium]|nr:type 4a pilus biogenesis protein PilO [Patescibacteria group bacterium]